ncbi:hypothetical protein ACHAWF_012843 [Thalassiosira exigua]
MSGVLLASPLALSLVPPSLVPFGPCLDWPAPHDDISVIMARANVSSPSSHIQPQSDQHESQRWRWEVAKLALASRVFLLMAMSLSCAVLPDFYPGDDVLQFDLRLKPPSGRPGDRCFCLQGHGCDPSWESRRMIAGSPTCADSAEVSAPRYVWLDRFYAFILPPVTKWDAARFLTLSTDPWARYPPQWHLRNASYDDRARDRTCDSDHKSCELPSEVGVVDGKKFHSSEQAHAFLPLWPLSIRFMTGQLLRAIPHSILPPTYEATTVLSAILINTFAFLMAALSLHDLTIYVLKLELLEKEPQEIEGDVDKRSKLTRNDVHRLARTSAQLFSINPAGVFFTAAYSESIFAMLTFTGHAIAARGRYYLCYLQKSQIEVSGPQRQLEHGMMHWLVAQLYSLASTMMWMSASYTRSNGTFSSLWWLLVGVSKCCSCFVINGQATKRKGAASLLAGCITALLFHCLLALLVAYPVYFHDQRGYNIHCSTSPSSNSPMWCDNDGISRFSLYARVQREHWNVGLLRYYEVKQIPNFILALPILLLSFASAASWIMNSWVRHVGGLCGPKGDESNICAIAKNAFPWAFHAMSASSHDFLQGQQDEYPRKSNTPSSTAAYSMLLGRKFLSYYAILACFAIVGTFVAHVQISTRLICSSCPALYWYITTLVIPHTQTGLFGCNDECSENIDNRCCGAQTFIYIYFALYNFLGSIMNVNWLPWT